KSYNTKLNINSFPTRRSSDLTNGKYADLINIEFEKNNIPITFAQGLGVKSSSTYRFIHTIFNWARNYYGVNEIKSIFVAGDIKIDRKSTRLNSSHVSISYAVF